MASCQPTTNPAPERIQQPVTTDIVAPFGAVVSAGVIQAAPAATTATAVSKLASGTFTGTATFRVWWDAGYLGVETVFADTTAISIDSTNLWDDDSVELYIDANNNRGVAYDSFDRQFVVTSGRALFEQHGLSSGVLQTATVSGNTLTVRYAVPWTNLGIAGAAGTQVGFDVGINDDDSGGPRDGQVQAFGTANNWTDTSTWARLTLQAASTGSFATSRVATNFDRPTQMAIAPDGRVFVLEQGGTIRVFKNGAVMPTPFVALSNVFSTQDYGLLGLAFDPNFATNNYVYVFYAVAGTPGHTRISRLTANGDVAMAGSEILVFQLDDRTGSTTHMGGGINFGADGKLYIQTGSPNDHWEYSQALTSTFGKVLRINADGTIPTDNPFYTTATGKYRAIWARGLRNPFTGAMQPGTSTLYINDNGQDTWEEINVLAKKANYGWPDREGNTGAVIPTDYLGPAYTYAHGDGDAFGKSVVGATFYQPATNQFPATYVGKYFFTDHVNGWIKYLDPANLTAAPVIFSPTNLALHPVDIDVAPDGSLYYLSRGDSYTPSTSGLYRVTYNAGSTAPAITQQPASVTKSVGQTATFCTSATGSPTPTYQWKRGGINISGATSACYTTPALVIGDNGAQFQAVASNSAGTASTAVATLTVTANGVPVPKIVTPAAGAKYNAGQTLSFSGTGTDPEDGTLPASAFTWWIEFRHNTHTHSALPQTSGITSGSIVPSQTDEKSTDVSLLIHLRVTDSQGASAEAVTEVSPNLVNLTLASSPSGLPLKLDGVSVTTPYAFASVVGIKWDLEAPATATLPGGSYQFSNWSDGGAALHTIAAPATATTFTANYGAVSNPNAYSEAFTAGTAPGWILSTNCSAASKALVFSSWSTTQLSYYNGKSFVPPYTYQVDLLNGGAGGDWNASRIAFNIVDANNFFYLQMSNANTPGANSVTLNKRVAGVDATIATYAGTYPTAGKTVKVTVSALAGNAFKVTALTGGVTTVLFNNVVNSTFTSGKVGVGMRSSNTTFDNVTVQ
ncbi:MAG: PQQ-dependent sugar dehydrogenase [Deltaproteobacteria bacterium]|nr:PQQ-dependent sugar dehydrogenase [Deltaproteobacteria bacterium]